MSLEGKVALVTGGTSGIGEASAIRFAKEGAKVFILGRNQLNGEKIAARINEDGGQAEFYSCDVSSTEDIDQVFDKIMSKTDRIDVLLNSAGVAPGGTIEDLSYDEWDRVFDINVRATYIFCKKVVPIMRELGGGSIINVSSSAGNVGANGLHAYSASKGAVVLLTRSMAADYSEANIRANCLCPGATKTPMMDGLGEEGLQEFAQMIPAKRMAAPEEIANVAYFLASEQSSFMYGSTVLVDGGFTAI